MGMVSKNISFLPSYRDLTTGTTHLSLLDSFPTLDSSLPYTLTLCLLRGCFLLCAASKLACGTSWCQRGPHELYHLLLVLLSQHHRLPTWWHFSLCLLLLASTATFDMRWRWRKWIWFWRGGGVNEGGNQQRANFVGARCWWTDRLRTEATLLTIGVAKDAFGAWSASPITEKKAGLAWILKCCSQSAFASLKGTEVMYINPLALLWFIATFNCRTTNTFAAV